MADKIYLGIDPGMQGGIAILYPDDLCISVMPEIDSDWTWFREIVRAYGARSFHAFVEKVHSMPKQGVASTFKFGTGFGFVRGLLVGLCVPVTLVTPQKWQSAMLAGENKDDKKSASRAVAARLWPDISFLKSSRSIKPHDGMCEAALIAEYGRRINGS